MKTEVRGFKAGDILQMLPYKEGSEWQDWMRLDNCYGHSRASDTIELFPNNWRVVNAEKDTIITPTRAQVLQTKGFF